MEKEENQNSAAINQDEKTVKETEKPEENLTENNKINHRLNFYKIEDQKLIEIF